MMAAPLIFDGAELVGDRLRTVVAGAGAAVGFAAGVAAAAGAGCVLSRDRIRSVLMAKSDHRGVQYNDMPHIAALAKNAA